MTGFESYKRFARLIAFFALMVVGARADEGGNPYQCCHQYYVDSDGDTACTHCSQQYASSKGACYNLGFRAAKNVYQGNSCSSSGKQKLLAASAFKVATFGALIVSLTSFSQAAFHLANIAVAQIRAVDRTPVIGTTM